MRRLQRISNLNRKVYEVISLQRLARDALTKRLAFEQLHREEGPRFLFANVVNDADIGVIQSRGGACLPLKPLQCRAIFGVIVREKLESHVAAQARVFSLVNHSHATRPELFENAVVGDRDRKSTRLNSSHMSISYAVFC